VNSLQTKLTGVKDIPYFVSHKFLKTYARDRYQLSQVERMVEGAYENYLVKECTNQTKDLQEIVASGCQKEKTGGRARTCVKASS
jgi:hypothetical protein